MIASVAAAITILWVQSPPLEMSPVGHWVNPAGTVMVELASCGEERLCGWVRWAADGAVDDAKAAGTDELVGTVLFHDFRRGGNGRWKGRLFVPDLRRTHGAELRLLDDGHLKVRGCAAAGLICKSQIWTRSEPKTVQ